VLAKPITAALPAALKHTKGTLVEVDGTFHGFMSAFADITTYPLWVQACVAAMVLRGTVGMAVSHWLYNLKPVLKEALHV
jgi:hypothetical protein